MTTAIVDSTAEDLKIAFAFGDKCAALGRFLTEQFDPAVERLKTAGRWEDVYIIESLPSFDALDGVDQILDELDIVRTANGHPGAAMWLLQRAKDWKAMDEIRAELDEDKADVVLAFDREFAAAYPELERLISRIVTDKARREHVISNRHRYVDGARDVEELTEVDGHPLEDIAAAVRAAVAKMTGAPAR